MDVIVFPGAIEGRIAANASKSAMQRAVAAALMATGKSIIYNPGKSNDCLSALEVAQDLGAVVHYVNDRIEITGKGIRPVENKINCGESGLGIRMFTPIAALSEEELTLEAAGSLKNRPVEFFEEVFPQLQVHCETQNGKPPIRIKGPLTPCDITVDGSLSSQFLTGLLMAYGSSAENETITVRNLKSKPYIDLTLQIMQHFGVKVTHENFTKFHFNQKQRFRACDYTVEGDWSGAAFLLVAGAIAGQVEVDNLNVRSAQSDKAILNALERSGAKVMQGMFTVLIEKSSLKSFDFDATDCPDLFPPLVALAANCKGISAISGVGRLAYKESDRGKTLQEEFLKLGIRIDLDGDKMFVHGGAPIQGAEVISHHDHRIAMACAVAALNATASVRISGAEAVNKSYPEFWDHWQKLGGKVRVIAPKS